MPEIYANIAVTLNRANEIGAELLKEYQSSLDKKTISPKATQLTHEICSLLNSALDRIARRYWEKNIASKLAAEERQKATIYFPVAEDKNGFESTLGRWQWKQTKGAHQQLIDYLLAKQPFDSEKNKWLRIVKDLAIQGKHIDLVPQKRIEERRISVKNARGAGVSWNPDAVRFGGRVHVVGAPIDPATQRIVPTEGVTEKLEIWVNFIIDGYGVDAAGFCKQACKETRRIVEEMTDQFALS